MKTYASVELIVDWSQCGHGVGVDGTKRKPLKRRVSVELSDELRTVITNAIRAENAPPRRKSAPEETNQVVAVSLSLPLELFQ